MEITTDLGFRRWSLIIECQREVSRFDGSDCIPDTRPFVQNILVTFRWVLCPPYESAQMAQDCHFRSESVPRRRNLSTNSCPNLDIDLIGPELTLEQTTPGLFLAHNLRNRSVLRRRHRGLSVPRRSLKLIINVFWPALPYK